MKTQRSKTTKAFSFSTTCRLCLAPQTNMIQIFDKNVPDLPNNIFYCLSLRVIQNDRLPHSVCNTCYDQVVQFVTFKQICHKADELLRESVNSDNTDLDQNLFDIDSDSVFPDENCDIKSVDKNEIKFNNDNTDEDIQNHFDNNQDDSYGNSGDDDDIEFNQPLVLPKHPGNRRGRPPGRKTSNSKTENNHNESRQKRKRASMLTSIVENLDYFDSDDDTIESYLISLERQDMIKEAAKSNYICSICFATSKTMLDFLDHQETHEGKPVFHCERCPEVFTKKLDLIVHEGQHQVPCPTCGKLVRPISLKTHVVSHTDKFKCQICGVRTGNKKQLESHDFLVHNEIREHVCETCGKRFKTKSALKTHNKSHSDVRAYPCKLCSYAGRTASGLYTHMTQHANDQIVCDVCAKIFTSRRRLNDHKWRIHNPEKKHECTFCFKKFAQKSKLTVHIRVHTGDRPFTCKLCARAFARSEVCRAHESKCVAQRFGTHCVMPNTGGVVTTQLQQQQEQHPMQPTVPPGNGANMLTVPPTPSTQPPQHPQQDEVIPYFKKEEKFCDQLQTELQNVM